ncbi:MAG TPA: ABC transporter ATP-binding protein [Rhizobiales bacterium]|nr:ABC transporter ATP-binding protein [Hyphomicrobiales bacterium]
MLEIDGLYKAFGPVRAVNGISLSVPAGEVLGFLGPNGAGKSTTMKMVAGFLEPDQGTARICGDDIVSAPREAKHNLGYLPEGAPAYGEMTPQGFLKFCAAVRGLKGAKGRDAVEKAIARTALASVADQTIETLSKGFKRRVGIAQAIVHEPKVLVLDEPTDGLDPNQKQQVRDLIVEMSKDRAIVISTHILEEVDAVCSRAVIIDRGKVVADGTADELRSLLPGRKNPSLEDVFRHITTGDAVVGGAENG